MPRVLIVEDDKPLAESWIKLLAGHNYDGNFALSGPEALEMFEKALLDTPFDAIITDYWMPGMNGEEFVRALRRKHPWRCVVPIIMVTGHLDEDQARSTANNLGTVRFRLKPVKSEDLLELLASGLKDARRNRDHIAEIVNHGRADFIRNIRDEFDNGFQAGFGFVDLAMGDPLVSGNEVLRNYLENALHAFEELRERYLSLLTLEKLLAAIEMGDTGDLPTRMDSIQQSPARDILEEGIKEAEKRLRGARGRRQAKLIWDGQTEEAVIRCDLDLLRMAISHMVHNALSFSDDVRVDVKKGAFSELIIGVFDGGEPIDSETWRDVCMWFEKKDMGLTASHKGLGLGIPTAKLIMEYHQGQLLAPVSAPDGCGKTIAMVLPQQRVDWTPNEPIGPVAALSV